MTYRSQFDTSGYVNLPATLFETAAVLRTSWHNLSPAVQGCIAGMLSELAASGGLTSTNPWPFSFSDLHPDTLARIIADWDRYVGACDGLASVEEGFRFWTSRQKGCFLPFPPVTPFLSDEGKVCLRDANVGGA